MKKRKKVASFTLDPELKSEVKKHVDGLRPSVSLSAWVENAMREQYARDVTRRAGAAAKKKSN